MGHPIQFLRLHSKLLFFASIIIWALWLHSVESWIIYSVLAIGKKKLINIINTLKSQILLKGTCNKVQTASLCTFIHVKT